MINYGIHVPLRTTHTCNDNNPYYDDRYLQLIATAVMIDIGVIQDDW